MLTVSVNRPAEWGSCEVHCFADLHIGDSLVNWNLINDRIKHCEETENCIVLLNGDLFNNATTASVSDTYSEVASPMQQLQKAVDLFGKLAEQGKIVAMTDGNHERRTYKSDGLDMSAIIATQLGIKDKYSPGAVLVFLRFGSQTARNHGKKMCYTIYCNHGAGGGSKIGGKANRLVSMSDGIDADIFYHAHTHEPIVVKRGFYRTNYGNDSVQMVERLYVNTAASMNPGGYGEIAEFVPNSTSSPIVILDGHTRKMNAIL